MGMLQNLMLMASMFGELSELDLEYKSKKNRLPRKLKKKLKLVKNLNQ